MDYKLLLSTLAIFSIVIMASKQIGRYFSKANLPLITGYLFAGIITGPYILSILSNKHIENLKFVDDISLTVIALAAGNELILKDIKPRLKSITWITIGNSIISLIVATFSIFFISDYIPFMSNFNFSTKIIISLLAGSILIARSPSSAIAIIKEMRAKGPFTQTILGVTVIMDVIVIIIFSIISSFTSTIIDNIEINFKIFLAISFDLVLSIILGYILSKIMEYIFSMQISNKKITFLIIFSGYLIFPLSHFIHSYSRNNLPFEIVLEPLLICLIASFLITNFNKYREELFTILHEVDSIIYLMFFTITGASLDLSLFVTIWEISIFIFFIRLFSLFIGSWAGGHLAGESSLFNRVGWMSYVTQAGVGLGLAKGVADKFPGWGIEFSTMIISVIIINQIVGPLFMKWALTLVKEAHPKAKKSDENLVHNVTIFGTSFQAIGLARQLYSHNWRVKLVCTEIANIKNEECTGIKIFPLPDITIENFEKINVGESGAIVTMFSDKKNYEICSLAYENYGRANLVVYLNDRANFNKFRELGAFIVSPSTAIISLLDHYVRTPSVVTLLLGYEKNQDIIDVMVEDKEINGLTLKDLKLPKDILILSIKRGNKMVFVHNHVHLKTGDILTISGSVKSLEEVSLLFEEVNL